MSKRNLVGVVTVTHNSASVIHGFMDSLLKQTHTELILYVVDNASSDNTLRLLSEYQHPKMALIPNAANLGVAEGNNIGIRAAMKEGCSSVLLINNDTVFAVDLVSKLLEGLNQHRSEMIIPKILYFDQPERIWCAGGTFSWIRGSARHWGLDEKDDPSFDQPREVNYGPTCCMLIKSEVFERIGLMDPAYFVYFDDTDFCRRAYHAGIRLFYLPSARLLHKVSSLTGSQSEFTIRHLVRNHVYYLLKNFPLWQTMIYLPAFQAKILAKYLFAPTKLRAFVVTEKGFFEGISLFRNRIKDIRKALTPTEVQ
jgi:GT2 family glycosyltransferase